MGQAAARTRLTACSLRSALALAVAVAACCLRPASSSAAQWPPFEPAVHVSTAEQLIAGLANNSVASIVLATHIRIPLTSWPAAGVIRRDANLTLSGRPGRLLLLDLLFVEGRMVLAPGTALTVQFLEVWGAHSRTGELRAGRGRTPACGRRQHVSLSPGVAPAVAGVSDMRRAPALASCWKA